MVEAPERLAGIKAAGHPQSITDNLLFANGIHCIDLLRHFGGDVAEMHSITGRWAETQKNSFSALLRFESGATGQYVSHWMAPGCWSATLYGMVCVSLCPLERATLIDNNGVAKQLPVDDVDLQYKPGLYAQDRFFLDCIKNGRGAISYPAADLADALKTVELIDAISGHEVEGGGAYSHD